MFRRFFNDIYNLLLGLFTVFKHSLKKRITGEYPEHKPKLPERFRGKHEWDSNKCCACKSCERVCPACAITVDKTEQGLSFKIDLKKCIFCGNCMYYCPKNAIKMSSEFELATDKKDELIIAINSFNSNTYSNIIDNE